jgi:hypothetical protein
MILGTGCVSLGGTGAEKKNRPLLCMFMQISQLGRHLGSAKHIWDIADNNLRRQQKEFLESES